MNKTRLISNEKLLAYCLLLESIVFYFHLILRQLGIANGLMNYIYYGVTFLFGIALIFRSLITSARNTLIIYGIVFLAVSLCIITNEKALSILIYSETGYFFTSLIFMFLFSYLPVFLLCLARRIDIKKFLDSSSKLSRINVTLFIVGFCINIFHLSSYNIEYMNYSYSALLPVFICVYSFSTKHHHIDLILSIGSFISLLFLGTRGAIFSLLLFFALICLLSRKLSAYKKGLIITSFVVLALLLYLNYDAILQFVELKFSRIQYKSRLVNLIFGGEGGLFHFDDRTHLYASITNHLTDRFFGYGIFGDRVILGPSGYAHNLVLEILVDFGCLIGAFILCLILLAILKEYKLFKKYGNEWIYFLSMTLAMLFGKYMFSGSLFQSKETMLFFGVLLSYFVLNEKRSVFFEINTPLVSKV